MRHLRRDLPGKTRGLSIAATLAGSLLISASATAGEDARTARERDLLDFFTGYCAMNMRNREFVGAAARASGWRKLEGDMAIIAGPMDHVAKWEGWIGESAGGRKFMIGVSEGTVAGQTAYICSVSSSKANPEAVISLLTSRFSLRSVLDDIEGPQRYTAWRTRFSNLDMVFHLTSVVGRDAGVTLAATVFSD